MCAFSTAKPINTNFNPLKNMKGKDFLTLNNFSQLEIKTLLDLAIDIKQECKVGKQSAYLPGKTLGMIFEKPSTRTRVSFETGIYQLGGMGMFLNKNDLQLARKEPIKDTARVMSSYLDGLMVRTFGHEMLEELAEYANIPVINGLTDTYHPCQVMADLLTVTEEFGKLKGVKMAYLGDGNNMANSLLIGGAKMGMEVAIGCPADNMPDKNIVAQAKKLAADSGGKIIITDNPKEAIQGSQVLYTDVWVSMGDEINSKEEVLQKFQPYQINEEAVKQADDSAIVMHCLPAHRDEEITESVLEGNKSKVFQQAENRLHAQKSIMTAIMS